jgi:hypothetical protein
MLQNINTEVNLGVGELRPDVSFPVLEIGEFRPDNILAIGELRPE